MIINLSIVVHAFPMHMMTLLSVDEILLPRYVNCSTNFRGWSLKMKMVLFFKNMTSVLSVVTLRSMPYTACSIYIYIYI